MCLFLFSFKRTDAVTECCLLPLNLFLILESMFDKILLGKRILSDSKCVNAVSTRFE